MQHTSTETRSVLASLRILTPRRQATFGEALRVAELHAYRLLDLWQITQAAVPSEIVSELPRVRIVRSELPVSGTSHWNGTHWIITLSSNEPWTRQRFTLMHEFKHIIDHGHAALLYTGDRRHTAREQAELVADYFAGCILMPRRLLKRAWCDGKQRPSELARHFGVSPRAVEVRLAQTGLSAERDRCARPIRSRGAHQSFQAARRQRSRAW
jgi:Zn-dependent peptidase ImmA (M78 family)